LSILISACQQEPIPLGIAENYLPKVHRLQKGIVSKFYEHHVPKNKDSAPYSNISYYAYKWEAPHWLTIDKFNAGMELLWHTTYQIKDDQWLATKKYFYFKGDTTHAEIAKPVEYDWVDHLATFTAKRSTAKDYQILYNNAQVGLKDTIIEDKACKKIIKNSSTSVISPKGDTTITNYSLSTIYAPTLGMYARTIEYEESHVHLELVEQMPQSEFEKRANHGRKRMAYIDPNNTLDDNSNFQLCYHESRIGDYYNCENEGQLQGGKGAWRRVLKKDLIEEQLKNESGYLTFRFVINCKGEAGRFMTEESDLNFNKKEFNESAVKHLYEIVSSQTDWQACTGGRRIKDQDAYTYITFKLKDGKIIDLLP